MTTLLIQLCFAGVTDNVSTSLGETAQKCAKQSLHISAHLPNLACSLATFTSENLHLHTHTDTRSSVDFSNLSSCIITHPPWRLPYLVAVCLRPDTPWRDAGLLQPPEVCCRWQLPSHRWALRAAQTQTDEHAKRCWANKSIYPFYTTEFGIKLVKFG